MALSSVIVQADSSKVKQVADKLATLTGVTVHTVTQNQIIALIEAATLDELEALALRIEKTENVLGVYPVYVTTEDEDDEEDDDEE